MITFLGTITALVLVLIARGISLSFLWDWFVASTFNIPTISIVQAIGIALTIRLFSGIGEVDTDKKPDWKKFLKDLPVLIFFPLAVLGIGYIIKLFF